MTVKPCFKFTEQPILAEGSATLSTKRSFADSRYVVAVDRNLRRRVFIHPGKEE